VSDGRPSAIRSDGSLRIGRVRLHHAAPGDRARLALGLEAVGAASVGVPDRALLIVPRLVVRRPLPRSGDANPFAGEVVDGLRAALRRARRAGEAASSGDCLFFADEFDAAVQAIEQWLAGAPPAERAWWPHVTGGAPLPVWWRREILPDGRRLPSVIARLARRGIAEPWLGRLDPGDVRTGLAAIAETHGLSLPADCEVPASASASARGRRRRPVDPDLAPAAALVEAIAPEARRADLPPPVRLLLLIGLIAERRPAMLSVRTATIAFAAVAAGRLPEPVEAALPPPPSATASPAPPPARPLDRAGTQRTEPDLRPASPPGTVPAARHEFAATGGPDGAASHESAVPDRVERVTPMAPSAPVEAPCPAAEIRSEYGGLLFLLSALLALGVYGDFSEPRRSLPGLSPFGLLRLLGRAWFGAPFVADPLHGLLVRLAGGRSADSARDFEARPWSVPRAWLLPWPDSGPALVTPRRRRPMLWHPAGFPLAELGPEPRSAVRAARQLGLKAQPSTARLPALPVPPRARWIACLRCYLEARIGRALGCAGGVEAVTLLCRRPARIRVDGDRIEARFALDDHPLAIRLAGLDRDPGWIPAARHDFRHSFE
jgi:hypothetical protein